MCPARTGNTVSLPDQEPDESQHERDDGRLIAIASCVERIGATVGLHPGAVALAASRIARQSKSAALSDAEVRQALFELKEIMPYVFGHEREPTKGKRYREGGKIYTAAELLKMHPRVRLSVVNGEKEAKL